MSTEQQSNFWSRFMVVLFALWVALIVPVPLLMQCVSWGDRTELVLPIFVIVFLVGAFSFRQYVTERHRNILLSTRPAEAVLAQDHSYIVYLRSFKDEQHVLKRYRRAWPTEEEQIAAAFDAYGSMIAIRDPAGELSVLGAARLSASGNAWKETVRNLVDNAAFVIVRLGDSHGVLWELNLVIHRRPPSRVLLLSALTAEAHAAATAMLKEHFDIRLPRHFLGAITFDEDWRPAVRFLHYRNLRGDLKATSLQVALQAALVPFFRRLGFEAELPPVRATRIVGTVFVLLVLAIMCWGGIAFPLFFILEPSGDGATMSAGFGGFMVFCAVVGIVMGVILVSLFARSVVEIWFPEHFVDHWWWRKLGKHF